MAACAAPTAHASTDSTAVGDNRPVWHITAGVSPAFVIGTNTFLQGGNPENKAVRYSLTGSLRGGFNFSPSSKLGRIYPGIYQGIGVDARTFFAGSLLGSPTSVHIYQGMPVFHFGKKLWLGYEWKFGAAFGWKYHKEGSNDKNSSISSPVTAQMAIAFKLNYAVSNNWHLSFAIEGNHFSNGNTEAPNAGVNTVGATIGLTYVINPAQPLPASPELTAEADRKDWYFDIMAYGAKRKRILSVAGKTELCPGKFGVAGLQFTALRKFNRWIAAGPGLDLQYDESSGLPPYHVEGTTGNYLKFYHPPFGKQIGAGISAHAELTAAIFAIDAGLGYEFICPDGNKAFYQSLSLKGFITSRLFLNVGYRLGNFKESQNLMLGAGIRL